MKRLITMTVALAMFMVMSTTAFAILPEPQAVITGADLTIADLGIFDFDGVTLNGTTQTTTAIVESTALTDSRGTGAGWQVSLKASPFTLDSANSALAVAAGGTGILPDYSLELGTISIDVVDGGSTPITNIAITQGKIDTTAGIIILSAPTNGGMGTYTVSMAPMTLTLLPATTYAGTYTSIITETLTTGPVA